MTLAQFLDQFDGADRSIVVVNRTDPDPVLNMLVDTFGEDAVNVVDETTGGIERPGDTGGLVGGESDEPETDGGRSDPSGELSTREFTTDRITDRDGAEAPREATDRPDPGDDCPAINVDVLREHEDVPFDGDRLGELENLALLVEGDRVIAGSTLDELGETVLLVNSDLYVTGARTLDEVDLPSVISGLTDTTFTLRGYPESNREKLLLITISRFIERAAWLAGDGTLRSSFQRLSRIDDEVGTRSVYERVSAGGVDTHLYGVPDDLPRDLDAVIHGGDSQDFTDSWFVMYRPPDGPHPTGDGPVSDLERGVDGGVAMLAIEVEPRVWRGLWTFDADRVESLNRYIERNL